jgi:hypothetical protein
MLLVAPTSTYTHTHSHCMHIAFTYHEVKVKVAHRLDKSFYPYLPNYIGSVIKGVVIVMYAIIGLELNQTTL